jgi:hypothetical protein
MINVNYIQHSPNILYVSCNILNFIIVQTEDEGCDVCMETQTVNFKPISVFKHKTHMKAQLFLHRSWSIPMYELSFSSSV